MYQCGLTLLSVIAGSVFMSINEKPISNSKKRGCPTCEGIYPKSCLRCKGDMRLCDWYMTEHGTVHRPTKMRDLLIRLKAATT